MSGLPIAEKGRFRKPGSVRIVTLAERTFPGVLGWWVTGEIGISGDNCGECGDGGHVRIMSSDAGRINLLAQVCATGERWLARLN